VIIYSHIVKAQQQKRDFAVVTIVKAQGSTPRGEDAKMLVYSNGERLGTIGGGELEASAVCDARTAIANNRSALVEYRLDDRDEEGLGMKCGGDVQVFIEVHRSRPRLIIAGAGHVGKALCDAACLLDFEIVVIDDRVEWANRERFTGAAEVLACESISKMLKDMELTEESFVVIATRGHMHDKEALAAVLGKKVKYIGMIGSYQKVKQIFTQLREEGFKKEELERVYSPVGLDIGGEKPEEIAISILAEMQKVRYSRGGGSLSTGKDRL
jgi:xanthine dehydrogenase accessory factor